MVDFGSNIVDFWLKMANFDSKMVNFGSKPSQKWLSSGKNGHFRSFFETFLVGWVAPYLVAPCLVAPYLLDLGLAGLVVDLDYSSLALVRVA